MDEKYDQSFVSVMSLPNVSLAIATTGCSLQINTVNRSISLLGARD